MAGFASACATGDEAALARLGGAEFHHEVQLAVPDWASWLRVGERLSEAGAEVHALHLTRAGAGFDVRCRVKRVSAELARALVRDFLHDGLAERGTVEHLVLASRQAP